MPCTADWAEREPPERTRNAAPRSSLYRAVLLRQLPSLPGQSNDHFPGKGPHSRRRQQLLVGHFASAPTPRLCLQEPWQALLGRGSSPLHLYRGCSSRSTSCFRALQTPCGNHGTRSMAAHSRKAFAFCSLCTAKFFSTIGVLGHPSKSPLWFVRLHWLLRLLLLWWEQTCEILSCKLYGLWILSKTGWVAILLLCARHKELRGAAFLVRSGGSLSAQSAVQGTLCWLAARFSRLLLAGTSQRWASLRLCFGGSPLLWGLGKGTFLVSPEKLSPQSGLRDTPLRTSLVPFCSACLVVVLARNAALVAPPFPPSPRPFCGSPRLPTTAAAPAGLPPLEWLKERWGTKQFSFLRCSRKFSALAHVFAV